MLAIGKSTARRLFRFWTTISEIVTKRQILLNPKIGMQQPFIAQRNGMESNFFAVRSILMSVYVKLAKLLSSG